MTTRWDGGAVVFVPHGHLHEGGESDTLEREIALGFEHGGKTVFVDLSETGHLSARALGILAQAHLEAHARGGRLTLLGLRPEHRLLLDVTGLLDVIDVQEEPAGAKGIRAA